MFRALRTPKDPEAITQAALALRDYAGGGTSPTDFEVGFTQRLQDLGVSTAAAQRLVDNFDSIRPSVRERFLGPQALPGATPPESIAPRDPATVTTSRTALPGFVFRSRLLFGEHFYRPPTDTFSEQFGDDSFIPANLYRIVYQGMHCVDETHIDFGTSDTTYIITSATHIMPNGNNEVRTERHPNTADKRYRGVDSGNTFQGPVASCWQQTVANTVEGMSVTTAVFENDKGDPDYYRDEVDAAVKVALAAAALYWPGLSPIFKLLAQGELLTDIFNWFLQTGDDLIGDQTVVLALDDLEDYGRSNRRTSYNRGGIAFNLPYHFVSSVNDNDYFAAFTVTREPNFPYPPPVVE